MVNLQLSLLWPPQLHARSFFLPPIIFYAGLSVKKKHFFRNFFTIAGYGIVGTYVCFALISICLYLFLPSYLTFGVSRRPGVANSCLCSVPSGMPTWKCLPKFSHAVPA